MNFAPSKWAMSLVFIGWLGIHCAAGAEAPLTRPDGPDAERLGMKQGYPVCAPALTRPDCRVGTWSSNEKVAASSVVRPAGDPMPLPRWHDAPAKIGRAHV
jgi:hypothetical protein